MLPCAQTGRQTKIKKEQMRVALTLPKFYPTACRLLIIHGSATIGSLPTSDCK